MLTKEEVQWQPIETAPKDGTEVLLFEIVDVWGDDAEYPKPYIYSGKYDHNRSEKYYGTKWMCLEYDAFNRHPTHWMPLPPIPKV